jgi:imidazoleglycerol-phosphate dehydratase/histidinol-phosphatase
MKQEKLLFIDRDGTLIVEPLDQQIDSLEKLALMPLVIPALLTLKQAGYRFVMVSNQDGLGSESFPEEAFLLAHTKMLELFSSQGIEFDDILICPHFAAQSCACRKPKLGLVLAYLKEQRIDREYSYVIGDRKTDVELAEHMGIKGLQLASDGLENWSVLCDVILRDQRYAHVVRTTNETHITCALDLRHTHQLDIHTGSGFFDHMLEQLVKHGGFSCLLHVDGDLEVDDHHTVEDTAIVLGETLKKALGDKRGIQRYGFTLPMDEALAQATIDLAGRPYLSFQGEFTRERVGDFATELVKHFFYSLSQTLGAAIHITVSGENNHHMIEAVFKAMGRALRQAVKQCDNELPSSNGVL